MNLTKIYFTFEMFQKTLYFCIFRSDFWQFSEKFKKLVLRFPISFLDPVFALRRRLKNPIIQQSQKRKSGLFFGEN